MSLPTVRQADPAHYPTQDQLNQVLPCLDQEIPADSTAVTDHKQFRIMGCSTNYNDTFNRTEISFVRSAALQVKRQVNCDCATRHVNHWMEKTHGCRLINSLGEFLHVIAVSMMTCCTVSHEKPINLWHNWESKAHSQSLQRTLQYIREILSTNCSVMALRIHLYLRTLMQQFSPLICQALSPTLQHNLP